MEVMPHTYDCADPTTPIASPFLSISLLRTAKLWSFLHPGATQGQRVALALEVAKMLGVNSEYIGG